MKYEEIRKNIFTVDEKYSLTECISADYELGKGIAVEFEKRFNLKEQLNKVGKHQYPECIKIDRVFNLVTKDKFFHKPTYSTLSHALHHMKKIALENDVKHIAMPLIGCGLDKLNWGIVSSMIKSVFRDTDIEILVCIKED